jgi:hypothetical protein
MRLQAGSLIAAYRNISATFHEVHFFAFAGYPAAELQH